MLLVHHRLAHRSRTHHQIHHHHPVTTLRTVQIEGVEGSVIARAGGENIIGGLPRPHLAHHNHHHLSSHQRDGRGLDKGPAPTEGLDSELGQSISKKVERKIKRGNMLT